MKKRNLYSHNVDLEKLRIDNCDKDLFRKKLEKIPYRGFEVEELKDHRKIIITKPGGKRSFGRVRREDIMVWIYNPDDSSLWLISHKDIKEEIEKIGNFYPEEAVKILNSLEEVYMGKDPDELLKNNKLTNPTDGEKPEVFLKAYKWIWGQEDCNYPADEDKGRAMSWEGWIKVDGEWEKTGEGLTDLRELLKKRIT